MSLVLAPSSLAQINSYCKPRENVADLFVLLSLQYLQVKKRKKMEGELRMQVQYDSRSVAQGEKPYINVLPNCPYEAYKRLDQETLAQVRKTQRIPLPQVRELILLYTLREQQSAPLEQSQLLQEKLIQTGMEEHDRTLNSIIEKWMMEQQRISKLSDVFEEYKRLREQLISRAVMKSKHNVQEQAQKFKNEVKQIDQQKNMRISALVTRNRENRESQHYKMTGSNMDKGFSKPEQQQQIRAIQREANIKTVQHIRSQNQYNIRYQSQQQDRLFGLRTLDVFLREFEKALVFIVGARYVENINSESVANQNYYKTFSDKLQHYKTKSKAFQEQLLNHLFDWRMDLKRDKPHDSRMAHFAERSHHFEKDIQSELYYFIPNILLNLDKDRQQLRNLNDYFTKNYESYLGTYYSIKEVQLYHSKQSHIEEVIENERNALNSHLKKNFGMMVPFKKSQQYEELSSLAISRDKPYLKTLMEQKISYLEQAIAYINYEHSKLYKEVCDNDPGASAKINKKIEDFQVLGAKYPELRAHLQQSCQRLLEIVNH